MARREQHLEVADHLAVGEGVATRTATQRDREAAPTKRLDERARTALVVVVVMDFIAQIQSHLMSHQYESLLKKANLKGSRGGLTR